MKIDRELDTSGLNCPLPLLRLKKALNEMKGGQIVSVTATDPVSVLDFRVFCEVSGNSMLERAENDGILTFVIQKKPDQ